MDPLIIISLSTSAIALVSSLVTHIKFSSCCIGKCVTHSNKNSSPSTPNLENLPILRARGKSDPISEPINVSPRYGAS